MSTKQKPTSGLFALKQIVEGTADHTGETFFRALVKNLSEVLDAKGVWITEYWKAEKKLNSLAFWYNGKYVDSYLYSVEDTPCEAVLENNDFCHFSDNVIQLFPKDKDLPVLNAVSYLGIALRDTDGTVLGHLAALDSRPMKEIPAYFAIFRIFASRAAAELRRLKREQLVQENKNRLDRILNGTLEAIIELDEQLNITQINQAAANTFGCKDEKLIGRHMSNLFTPQAYQTIMTAISKLKLQDKHFNTIWLQENIYGITASKEEFPADVTLSVYQYQSKNYFALFIRNIKDKVQVEEELKALNVEANMLRNRINESFYSNIIGRSNSILKILDLVAKVAPTDSTVLILGETGTGKELIAEAIYKNSKRNKKVFVGLNCAALPAELIESELFGHVKGAFTGASSAREGRFSMADGGTIFLDEIGEMPLNLQSKLLRIIQEGKFEPVGSSKTIKVDVRIIAATHRDLSEEIKQNKFREDLYYRLNVFPIVVPPLRERGNDILLLAQAFIDKLSRREGQQIKELNELDKQAILHYPWPGNVRELQNVIERAIITTNDGTLDLKALLSGTFSPSLAENVNADRILSEQELRELQKQNILRALNNTNWKISGKNGAANLLQIATTTLSSRMQKYGIKKVDAGNYGEFTQ